METIAQFKTKEVFDIVEPTVVAFRPLLEVNRAQIQEIPRKTFQYGPTDRHQLDIYYPITPSSTDKTQILVWVYGGGFVSGDRQLPAPADLSYASLGSFFAHRGFIVIIPDYRLAPATIFPGAAEDVRDAILWAKKNPQHLTTPTSPNPDTSAIFLMGHSAGAIHSFAALAIPETPESKVLLPSISGLIFHGGATFEDAPHDNPVYGFAVQHYGGVDGLKSRATLGLLRAAPATTISALPRTLIVVAENEPDWILKENEAFLDALEEITGKKPTKIVAKGHNHISPNVALGSGQGEDWAEAVIAWIR